MRVLLTGAAGFIGRHVHTELRACGHDVVPYDSLRPDVHSATIGPIDGLIRADVRDPAALDAALRGVDAVAHLAAKVGHGLTVADLPDYASNNDHGTAEVLAAMARAGVCRLVLASSMVVYGDGLGRCAEHGTVTPGARDAEQLTAGHFEPPCPYCGHDLQPESVTETAPLDPRSAYAASKLAQETYAASWARETDGSVAALRYHNVYGPGLPHDTPYAGVAAIFLSALRRGQGPQVFEDGGQRRDFVHVRDVATATAAAINGNMHGFRAYNVGSGTAGTVGALATELAAAVDGPPPVITGHFRAADVRHITADSARIRDELGWAPQMTFADGMTELAASAAVTAAAV